MQTEISIKENTKMIKEMDKAYITMLMGISTMVSGRWIKLVGEVIIK